MGQVFYGPYPSGSFNPANPNWQQVLGYNPEANIAEFSDNYRPYMVGHKINPFSNVRAGEVIRPGWTDPAMEKLCNACCTGVLEANLNSNVHRCSPHRMALPGPNGRKPA
jgi:hypothetical protein